MDSSEGKGRLIDQARVVRSHRKRKLHSTCDRTNEIPKTQTGSKTNNNYPLITSETEYRATLDAMRDAVHVVDRDLRVVLINEKLCKLSQEYGLDVLNAAGRTIFELFPFLPDSIRDEYAIVFNEGRVLNTEDSYTFSDKEIIVEVRRLPIFEAGRVVRAVTIIRDITERKRAEEKLRCSEERLSEAQQIAGLGSWARNIETNRQIWSDNTYRLFGFEPGEVNPTLETFLNMVHPDDKERITRQTQEVTSQGKPFQGEYRIIRKDGTVRWIYSQSNVRLNDTGEPVEIIGIAQDITERRKAEEALRENESRYRAVVDNAGEGIVVVQGERLQFVNPYVEAVMGCTQEELKSRPFIEFIHPDDRGRVMDIHVKRFKGDEVPAAYEFRVIDKDGNTRCLENNGILTEWLGRPATLNFLRDITERKRIEEALHRERDRAQSYLDVAAVMMVAVGNDQKVTLANRKTCEVLGVQEQDIIGKNWFDHFIPERLRELIKAGFNDLISGQNATLEYYENPVLTTKGEERLIAWHNTIIRDINGNITGTLSSGEDITERKKAQVALLENQERYRRVVEDQTEFIVRWLPGGIRTFVNESYCRYFGISLEQAVGTSCWPLVVENFHRTLGEKIESLTPDNPVSTDEIQVIRRDGTTGWNFWTTRALFNEHGRLIEYQAVGRDITERKRAEEELARQRYYLERAQEIGSIGTWDFDIRQNKLIWTDETYRIFGLAADAKLDYETFLNCVHPEDRDHIDKQWKEALNGGLYETEFRILVEGKIKWVREKADLEFDEHGNCVRATGFTQDITDRKKVRDAIEDRLQFERLLSGISSRFINLPACEVDKAIEDGLGLVGGFFGVERVSIGQFVGPEQPPRTTHGWFAEGWQWEPNPDIDNACYPNVAVRLLNEGFFIYEKPEDIPESWTQERKVVSAAGLKAGSVVAMSAGGKLIGAIAINCLRDERTWPLDIAERLRFVGDIFANALERKRVDDALKESEAKFKSLAEQSPNMIFINKAGRIVYANEKCEEVMGYTREELCAPDFDFFTLIAAESAELIRENIARHSKGEEVAPHEYTVITKTGERIEVINATRLIQYEGQAAILGIVTDITEHKNAEHQLRESEQKFRSYIDNAPDGVAVVDGQGRLVEANEAICNMTGYSKDELLIKSFCDILTPESLEAGIRHFNKVAREGWASDEFAYQKKNGQAGYWSIDAVKISDDRFLGFVKDISENKRAEEALRASEEKFRSIFDTAPNLITSVNEKGIIVDCNRRILDILGYQKEEIIGQSMAKIIHPDYLSKAEKALQEILTTGFSYNKEYKMVRKDGSSIDVSINSSGLKDQNGRPVRTLCIIDNITDRKQAEQKILENRAQLKSLASKLSLTEERERRRLATELHDQIGQSLVISKIKLDQLRESTDDQLTAALGEVCRCLEQVIQDTRMLTFDLSSPILYELGFEAAVAEWLTDEVRKKHGIHTEFDDDGLPKPLDEDMRALLFRNVRELLINTVKHARAGKVKVSLRKVDKHVNVTVEDDGAGFDPVEVRAKAVQRAEFGLFSIRERLEQLGGHLEIESGPGQGSRITMTAPLKSESNS